MTRLRVLGTLELEIQDKIYSPRPPKQRQVLGLLSVCANRIVSLESIIEELWGDTPPRSATTTAQTYVYQIRKNLSRLCDGPESELLETASPGYILHLAPEQLDVAVFREHLANARAHFKKDNRVEASRLLWRALRLWRGGALEDIPLGPLLRAHVAHLEEQRLQALEMRIQMDLLMDRHRDMVGELKQLIAEYPLNEWFYAQLMRTLQRSGRRGEALQVYQVLRRTLQEELGIEPSLDLQQLQRAVLKSGEGGQQHLRVPSVEAG
ncbi:AfsR/SARP family transcriptional regulator [Nonomuraea sp. NPDC048882]|uniref:AfsR/SARP family transcriptional regulator n=1 Tax=unclassified Nonomuraea TaxID=2593643 RepID=UPI0033FCBE91